MNLEQNQRRTFAALLILLAVLMIGSENDELYPEDLLIYDHLGSPDRSLITFLGQDQMMIYDTEMSKRMTHFAVAFFGTQLQVKQELSEYYSQEFVNQHNGLVWGAYQDQ